MSAPVFFCPDAADARVGVVLDVTGDEAHHAVTVQRRAVGEAVDLVDGVGVRACGEIVAVGDRRMSVRVDSLRADDDPDVTLVQALAKGGRDEQAVEAAVELGATRIIPWAAQRSIVQWRGPKADKQLAKWQALIIAATKQSRRARVAALDPLMSTSALATTITHAVAEGARVLVLHESATRTLASVPWPDARQAVWLIVGPEGGIGDDELDRLRSAGAEPVRLGPHVLRASNAGPTAIAALAVARGTWGTADDDASGRLR